MRTTEANEVSGPGEIVAHTEGEPQMSAESQQCADQLIVEKFQIFRHLVVAETLTWSAALWEDPIMPRVDIAAETQALPLGYYLSAPLTAAVEAQALSAQSTIDFIDALGTDDFGELRTMEFKYKKSVTNPETNESAMTDVELVVPLLSMTEAPHISIEKLTVDFSFTIKDVISKESQFRIAAGKSTEFTQSTKAKAAAGANFGFISGSASVERNSSFKMNMNVSTSFQSTTRTNTERQATLKMHMTAQQRVPEGFQKVLQIFADAITSQAEVPSPSPSPT